MKEVIINNSYKFFLIPQLFDNRINEARGERVNISRSNRMRWVSSVVAISFQISQVNTSSQCDWTSSSNKCMKWSTSSSCSCIINWNSKKKVGTNKVQGTIWLSKKLLSSLSPSLFGWDNLSWIKIIPYDFWRKILVSSVEQIFPVFSNGVPLSTSSFPLVFTISIHWMHLYWWRNNFFDLVIWLNYCTSTFRPSSRDTGLKFHNL